MAVSSLNISGGEQHAAYVAEFDRIAPTQIGPEWLGLLRRGAIAAFAKRGFPTRRDEEWRFTPLASIVDHPFTVAEPAGEIAAADVDRHAFPGLPGSRIVLVDGRYCSQHSRTGDLPAGVRVGSLADALTEDSASLRTNLGQYASVDAGPFVALNTAFFADGAYVVIPRGVSVEQPIHILSLSTGAAQNTVSHPRVLVLAGENSQASIIESYAGLGGAAYWTNAVTEIVVGDYAAIEHVKVHREGDEARHIATTQIQMGRSSSYSSQNITLGGLLTRNDINAILGGEGGSCTLNGLFIAGGSQIVDNHTMIDHAMPRCESHELYKGILDGHARGVFNGKIFVRPDAQKTNAKQTNKTLLLSPTAQIDTKPQLEIYADDVKCTHGAAVGQPDEEAIFYLRTRGIGEADARALMTYAFAGDIINRIKFDTVRRELERFLGALGLPDAGVEPV